MAFNWELLERRQQPRNALDRTYDGIVRLHTICERANINSRRLAYQVTAAEYEEIKACLRAHAYQHAMDPADDIKICGTLVVPTFKGEPNEDRYVDRSVTRI